MQTSIIATSKCLSIFSVDQLLVLNTNNSSHSVLIQVVSAPCVGKCIPVFANNNRSLVIQSVSYKDGVIHANSNFNTIYFLNFNAAGNYSMVNLVKNYANQMVNISSLPFHENPNDDPSLPVPLQTTPEFTSPSVQTRNDPINLVIAEGYLRFSNDTIMMVNSVGNLIVIDSSKSSYGFPLQSDNLNYQLSNTPTPNNTIFITGKQYVNKLNKIVFSNDMVIEKYRKDAVNIKGMNAFLHITPSADTTVTSTAFQQKTQMSDLNKS